MNELFSRFSVEEKALYHAAAVGLSVTLSETYALRALTGWYAAALHATSRVSASRRALERVS